MRADTNVFVFTAWIGLLEVSWDSLSPCSARALLNVTFENGTHSSINYLLQVDAIYVYHGRVPVVSILIIHEKLIEVSEIVW